MLPRDKSLIGPSRELPHERLPQAHPGGGPGPVRALAYGGDRVWSVITEPLDGLRQKQRTLERDIQRRQTDLAGARRPAKALEAWSAESLPADPQVARSVYQAWLLQAVGGLELTGPAVDSTQPTTRGGYLSITFTLHARGTLRQWTQFLYEFYRTGYLHQVRSLAVTPAGKKQELDVDLTIEALVLPTAEDAERLEKRASTGWPTNNSWTTSRS